MKPMNISINELGRMLHVPAGRISEIVNGKRSLTADTALRLARCFDTTPDLWVGMQAEYDLRMAALKSGERIEEQVRKAQEQSL